MSGHKPFQNLADKVTAAPENLARVKDYRRLMDSVVSLYRLREQRGHTQVDLAKTLKVTQGNVSRVENSRDLYVSTLANYVAALGGKLELNAVFPDQVVSVDLSPRPAMHRNLNPRSQAVRLRG